MTKVIDADNIRYTKRNEWVMIEDNVITIGITDHAQRELSDVSFVEMPAEETELAADEEAATLEARDDSLVVLSPMDGVVMEVNKLLEDAPGLVNTDPYGDGWLYRMEVSDVAPWRDLLTADEYEKYISV